MNFKSYSLYSERGSSGWKEGKAEGPFLFPSTSPPFLHFIEERIVVSSPQCCILRSQAVGERTQTVREAKWTQSLDPQGLSLKLSGLRKKVCSKERRKEERVGKWNTEKKKKALHSHAFPSEEMALIQAPNYSNAVRSTSQVFPAHAGTNICNPLNALKKLMLQPRNLSGALLAGWRRSVPPLIGSSECDPRPGPRIMEDQLRSDVLTQELLVREILTLNVDKWYFSSILACIKKGEMSIQCGPFHLIQHLLF